VRWTFKERISEAAEGCPGLIDAVDQVERLALVTGNFTSSAKSLAFGCCGSAALINESRFLKTIARPWHS
jgi:hypothetical protein